MLQDKKNQMKKFKFFPSLRFLRKQRRTFQVLKKKIYKMLRRTVGIKPNVEDDMFMLDTRLFCSCSIQVYLVHVQYKSILFMFNTSICIFKRGKRDLEF